jgi:hypothetical protein
MSIETIVLLENISTEAATAGFSYGEKRKGAGYHKSNNGVHTAVFQFNNFVGTVKIQGTLELYPNDTDWVDIDGTTITVEDSSALTNDETRTFIGKFVYIRAAYNVQNGTITEIRYNH